MPRNRTKKNPYLFTTVDALSEFAEVTPRWIYQLIQDHRLWKNADGLIDAGAYGNIGIMVTMLSDRKLTEFTEYVRARYRLKPAPKMPEGAGFPE